MLSPIIESDKIEKLLGLISESDKIIITSHVSPDGDALGSSLAMARMLEQFGKTVHVITPDAPSQSLKFIPGVGDVLPYTKHEEFAAKLISDSDLIFCLDYNEAHRVDNMEGHILEASAPKVMIDHHTNPSDFPTLTISHPEISSTCMLLFRVFCQLGWSMRIDKTIASCIYIGMMTDTGNFSYNSLDPDLYIVISELLKKGINKDELYRQAFNVKSESRLRLNGYAIDKKLKVYNKHHAALITLSLEELESYGYNTGDTEGLVNVPLSIPEVEYVAFIREGKEYVKVSMRSVGNLPVNIFCSKYYGGGGHLNAAGGEFYGSLEDAVKEFETHLEEFDKYITKA